MKTILVVFTGGTIGSSVEEHTIAPDTGQQFRLLDLYQQHPARAADISFIPLAPYAILSENLVPAVWEQLIQAIESVDKATLDGIIVTHGTDTLAFTASMLDLFYRCIDIPLLVVSSDYPLIDARANGLENFHAAVEFIRQRAEAGVFVPYKNQQHSMHIHLGRQLTSCLPLSSDFISVQHKPYLHFTPQGFQQLHTKPAAVNQDLWPLKPVFFARILLIRPYPGLDYRQFNLQQVDAVLHDLYHSGTACESAEWGEAYSLSHFMRTCAENQIPVYLAPAIATVDAYASTQELVRQGAVFIWNTSLESAYVSLLLGFGNFQDSQRRARLLQSCCAISAIED